MSESFAEVEVIDTELTVGTKTIISFFVTVVAANVFTYVGMAAAAKWLKKTNDAADEGNTDE